MSEKIVKLIKQFVRHSAGNIHDEERMKKEFKKLNWIEKSKQTKYMKEILGK